jgi:hypothetical protein
MPVMIFASLSISAVIVYFAMVYLANVRKRVNYECRIQNIGR